MSKQKNAPAKPVFHTPTQMDWNEERLAALGKEQLLNLLQNLQTQRGSGRVAEETAAELEQRIRARLPARAIAVRRKRARSEVQLEARVAQQLGALAVELAERYDLSPATATRASTGTKGFRAQPLTDSRQARAGGSVKTGRRRSNAASPACDSLASPPRCSPISRRRRAPCAARHRRPARRRAAERTTPLADSTAGRLMRARMRRAVRTAEAALRYEALLARGHAVGERHDARWSQISAAPADPRTTIGESQVSDQKAEGPP
jgi:hypothetical protein